jgi:aspartate-semialdehyde dehydrogenase
MMHGSTNIKLHLLIPHYYECQNNGYMNFSGKTDWYLHKILYHSFLNVCNIEWLTVVSTETKAPQVDGSKTYIIIHTQILSDASTITALLFKKSDWTPKQKELLVIPLHWILIENKLFVMIIHTGLVIMK